MPDHPDPDVLDAARQQIGDKPVSVTGSMLTGILSASLTIAAYALDTALDVAPPKMKAELRATRDTVHAYVLGTAEAMVATSQIDTERRTAARMEATDGD